MGIADRDYMRAGGSGSRLPTTWRWRFIILCAVVWFGANMLMGQADMQSGTLLNALAVSWDGVTSGRIWTLFTSGIFHLQFGHLFWNMFGVWLFGGMIEGRTLFGRQFLTFIVASFVFASFCQIAADASAGTPAIPALGASGFVSALLVLAALQRPHHKILLWAVIPMPLWLLATMYMAADIIALGDSGSGVAHWAHLGGGIYGALVWKIGVFPNWQLPRWKKSASAPKAQIGGGGGGGGAQRRDGAERERVDALLAKISRDGIGSLTDEERAFLNEASRRY